jgi:hypothetical protein
VAACRSLLSGLVLSAVVLTGLAAPASAAQASTVGQPKSMNAFGISAENSPQPAPPGNSYIESLTLPVVSEEMSQLASDLTKNFADDPQFASAEVPAGRDRVIVHWHGKQSARLSKVLSGHASVPVDIRQTKFQPGVLRQRASTLSESDIDLKSFSINHDGSGLRISVSKGAQSRKPAKEIVRQYEEKLQAPVVLAEAGPEPANYERQFDTNWHLGGARLYSWTNGTYNGACSSGFAVRQNSTGNEGTMFAAHCALLGSEWSAWDQGPYYYPWGNVTANDYFHDGSIIHSGTSYGFMWTSTWDSDVYAQINGDAYPYIGQEVCYSGSYSGLKCGNIVKNTAEKYQFPGYPQQITAFRTEQSNSQPAAGNGDSGGPGYQLVSTQSGVKRLAVGIISARPGDAGPNCQGVPGSSDPNGRKCSPTVYATSVSSIAAATGWHIPAS